MSDLVRYEAAGLRKVEPRRAIAVRRATQDDFDWIDALQKSESDKVGFMWEQAIRKRIDEGNVFVAEATSGQCPVASGQNADTGTDGPSDVRTGHRPLDTGHSSRFAGYCLGVDRYMKQDHVGIIYQMCVRKEFRRSLVAATLLQARFDTSAYGTKLYGCWCKQSLEANRFWSACGFVPLAFRAAGRSTLEKLKKREGHTAGGVHIYWQKRVRAGDVETPWWYPYETSGGAMMEGRVVLPLPPEVQWWEAAPVVLPGQAERDAERRLLEGRVEAARERERAVRKQERQDARGGKNGKSGKNAKGGRGPQGSAVGFGGVGGAATRVVGTGGFGFGVAPGFDADAPEVKAAEEARRRAAAARAAEESERLKAERAAARKALKAAQRKNDPRLLAYARELRDRWQEHAAPGSALAKLIEAKGEARYAVGRLRADAGDAAASPAGQDVGMVEVKRLAA